MIYAPLAIRMTLITRMMVGLIGMIFDSTSSSVMPTMDSMTIPMSSKFHLERKKKKTDQDKWIVVHGRRRNIIIIIIMLHNVVEKRSFAPFPAYAYYIILWLCVLVFHV